MQVYGPFQNFLSADGPKNSLCLFSFENLCLRYLQICIKMINLIFICNMCGFRFPS